MTLSTHPVSPQRGVLFSRILALVTIILGLALIVILLHIIQSNVLGGMVYEGATVRYAEPSEVCPGDTLHFAVPIVITEPGMANLGRDWCEAGTVRCNLNQHREFNNVVITTVGMITSTSVLVPKDDPWFKPGESYEYRSGLSFSPEDAPARVTQDKYVIRFTLSTSCP